MHTKWSHAVLIKLVVFSATFALLAVTGLADSGGSAIWAVSSAVAIFSQPAITRVFVAAAVANRASHEV